MKYIFTHSLTTQYNFGQLHAPAALLPGKNPLSKCISLDDVASCFH